MLLLEKLKAARPVKKFSTFYCTQKFKDSEDINMKLYYKQYCKILAKVIKEAKRLMYNNQVINSTDKTTWNIIKRNKQNKGTYLKQISKFPGSV
jgi:hypothetical protein